MEVIRNMHPFDAHAALVRDAENNVLLAKQRVKDAEDALADAVDEAYDAHEALDNFVATRVATIPMLRNEGTKVS